jgi:hypothetical protein
MRGTWTMSKLWKNVELNRTIVVLLGKDVNLVEGMSTVAGYRGYQRPGRGGCLRICVLVTVYCFVDASRRLA